MPKRRTLIELQSKPENKAVRRIVEKAQPVEFAPIKPLISDLRLDDSPIEDETNDVKTALKVGSRESSKTLIEGKLESTDENMELVTKRNGFGKMAESDNQPLPSEDAEKNATEKAQSASLPLPHGSSAQGERLRIFQTSSPVNRTLTKFQKAAIVVRGDNGKQLIELLWRDQMNDKTRDIWDFLCKNFVQAPNLETSEVVIRKRDILQGSGVKSDRTFISAIYTLEDMGLINVRRLSGNKEGNVYILTQEGREEIDAYHNSAL